MSGDAAPAGLEDVMTIIGLDTSLAAFGYAVARLCADGALDFVDAGCWTTRPGGAEKRGDDVSARWMSIYRRARALCGAWKPRIITVEAVALPWGRTSMLTVSALGRARAIADALAVEYAVMLLERSAQALKVAATGNRKASKQEVIAALRAGHPSLAERLNGIPVNQQEHAADAAASILAAREHIERMGETRA